MRLNRVWADFNDIDTENEVSTLRVFAEYEDNLAVGEQVMVHDGDSNSCLASVVELDDRQIKLKLDLTSFGPEEEDL